MNKTLNNFKSVNTSTNSGTVFEIGQSKYLKNASPTPYQNLKIYMAIATPIIILMIYFIYKYNFKTRTNDVIVNMNYSKELKLQQLQPCSQLDKSLQYKLCDYYIATSYMSPCVGNQHYDYVSIDMIKEVLQSGARYIDLPICESSVLPDSIPVVATAQYGQRIITSLNTLDIRETFNAIRSNAFLINKNKINYPLFIHLTLNTMNINTMNILADVIKETMNDIILQPTEKYNTLPIGLEKLCNLLGKIIFFASPEYMQSPKLKQFITPNNLLFETYHYSQLSQISLPDNQLFNTLYNNKLSSKEQNTSQLIFKNKYPSIEFILQNKETIGKIILNDADLLDNLTAFNKIGLTLIKAQNPEDVLSGNYNPAQAIYFGCNFISMNYQINDNNMKTYLSIFKDSSFKLKPSSMRFSESENYEIPSTILSSELYQPITSQDTINILNDIYYKYNNMLIALESYSLPGSFLTQTETDLRFRTNPHPTPHINIKSTNNTKSLINTKNIKLEQCFIIKKSNITQGREDIPVYLESANYQGMYITLGGNGFFALQNKLKTNRELLQQSFYFEKPQSQSIMEEIREVDDNNIPVSLRIIDENNKQYLTFSNKIARATRTSTQIQTQNNMSYYLHVVPFHITIMFQTLFGGVIKTMSGSIVGVLENNITDGTHYILEPINGYINITGKNFIYHKDPFYLKNSKMNTYLGVSSDTGISRLIDGLQLPINNEAILTQFTMEFNNGLYSLKNEKNDVLIVYNSNLLKFIPDGELVSNENLFKISLEYVLH